jgi:piRNA pathway germ-plasm component
MSSCLEHAKETHQIPLRNFSAATDNYRQIYRALTSFIRPMTTLSVECTNERDRRRSTRVNQPCLFFPGIEYEQTRQLFDWLQEKSEGAFE